MAVLLTLSGGMAAGDRHRIEIASDPEAALSCTTQAAERIYRSDGPSCVVDLTISIAEGAWLDWVPRPTILFDGARLRRRTTVKVAPGGRLLACDGFVFGRMARGEAFSRGALLDRWRVERDGRPVWVDAVQLEDPDARFASPTAFGEARAMATALFVGEGAARHLDAARAILADTEERASVTLVNDVLVARFLGRAPSAVQRDLTRYLGALRARVSPYSASLPRIGNE